MRRDCLAFHIRAMTCSHLARPCRYVPTEKTLLLTYFFWQVYHTLSCYRHSQSLVFTIDWLRRPCRLQLVTPSLLPFVDLPSPSVPPELFVLALPASAESLSSGIATATKIVIALLPQTHWCTQYHLSYWCKPKASRRCRACCHTRLWKALWMHAGFLAKDGYRQCRIHN